MIFDCDGVLVDSERLANVEFAAILREIGLEFTLPQMIDTFVGNSMPRCVEIIAERLGHAPPADILDRYRTRVAAALPGRLHPVAGVVALLDALEAAGIPYCVASNGERPLMQTKLETAGLLSRFATRRFSAADVARPKPAPDLFLHAARVMGTEPAACVVIEDSPLGVAGARAAGMTTIGFADLIPASRLREAGADFVVTDLAECRVVLGLG